MENLNQNQNTPAKKRTGYSVYKVYADRLKWKEISRAALDMFGSSHKISRYIITLHDQHMEKIRVMEQIRAEEEAKRALKYPDKKPVDKNINLEFGD